MQGKCKNVRIKTLDVMHHPTNKTVKYKTQHATKLLETTMKIEIMILLRYCGCSSSL